MYLATLRARLRFPAVLLVQGPDRVPAVTDPAEAAQSPELAVLSAMAHGSGSEGGKVLHALLAGLKDVDDDYVNLYADLVLVALPAAARARLEELMTSGTYEYQSDFARRYYGQGHAEGEAQGRAEGEVNALLAVLAARQITVPDDARARITACSDHHQLDTWIRRAVTIRAIDELFD